MAQQNRSRHTGRLLGLVVGVLFAPALASAQQPTELQIVTDRTTANVGQAIQLTLKVPDVDPSRWDSGNLALPEGIFISAGPNIRSGSWTEPDGRVRTGTQAVWSLSSRRSGIYVIRPFTLIVDGKRFLVSETVLSFVPPEDAGLRFPLVLNWIAPDKVWAGQSFFLALQVRNLEFVPEPGAVVLTLRQDAVISNLNSGGDLRQYLVGPYQLLKLNWAAWSVTPLRAGNLVIPPTSFTIAGARKFSPEIVIPVLPVPFDNPSGAVGNFQRTANLEASIEQFDLVLVQTISGLGNFPVLKVPTPRTRGLILINQTEEQNYSPKPLGYEGSLTKRFYYQKTDEEEPFLTVPEFTFFNPMDQKLSRVPELPLNPGLVGPGGGEEMPESSWPNAEEIRQARKLGLLEQPLAYLALLPGLVLFLIILLRPRSQSGVLASLLVSLTLYSMAAAPAGFDERYEAVRALYLERKIEEALVQIDKLIADYPEYPLLLYPRALILHRLGREAETLVEVLRLESFGIFNEGIDALRTKLAERSPTLSMPRKTALIDGDSLYFLIVLSVNAGLVFLGFGLRKGSVFHLSTSVFCAMILVIGLGIHALSGTMGRQNLAVIGPEAAALRRIPESNSESGVALEKGTLVTVLGKANHHLRVQTADGMEGWVFREEVLEVYRSR